ncbi:hypothetical protein SBADM41S_00907 [Streptomyces badius]
MPLPGWTCTTEAANLSSLLTLAVAASLAAFWRACGSSVVRIVRPPWFQIFARSALVLPKTGSLRNTSRT